MLKFATMILTLQRTAKFGVCMIPTGNLTKMKSLLSLLLACLALHGAAQIPSSNFEVWVSSPQSGLLPQGWVSDNTAEVQTVIQDLDAYEGNYSMMVLALPTGIGEYGYAATTFPIDYIPAVLTFYAKTAVLNASVQVDISFYNENTLFETFYWFGTESNSEWTQISIPLIQNEPVLTHATIQVIAQVGDFAVGSAQISVDAMALIHTLGTANTRTEAGAMFPNPTAGEVNFSAKLKAVSAKVYNSSGKLIKTVQLKANASSFSLSGLPKGEYIVRFEGAEGKYLHSGKVVLVD